MEMTLEGGFTLQSTSIPIFSNTNTNPTFQTKPNTFNMKFTAVLALAMASFAVAAPTDFSASDIEARTNTPSTPPPSGGDSVCSDNRKQVNVQETQGVLGLISIVGTILNQNGGGAYCCDASAPQFGLINLNALNCVKIL
jgi:hypothetical protein